MNDTENTELKTGPEAEAEQPKEKLFTTREEFEAQAEDIFATMNQALDEGKPLREGYRMANEAYVQEEENPELSKLADLILSAPAAARAHNELNSQSRGYLDHEHHEQLINLQVGYINKLRSFIFDNASQLDRKQLREWVEKGSNGDEDWAERIMTGATGEVAVARQLQRTKGVRSVRFGTPEEDKTGIDMVVTMLDGSTHPLDVKIFSEKTDKIAGYSPHSSKFVLTPEEVVGFDIWKEAQKSVSENFLKLANRD